MADITVTHKVVQAAVGIKRATAKPTRGSLNSILVLLDLIRSVNVTGLGGGEDFGFFIVILLQWWTVSIDAGGGILDGITSGLNGVMGDLLGNLKNQEMLMLKAKKADKTYRIKDSLLFWGKFFQIAQVHPSSSTFIEFGYGAEGGIVLSQGFTSGDFRPISLNNDSLDGFLIADISLKSVKSDF